MSCLKINHRLMILSFFVLFFSLSLPLFGFHSNTYAADFYSGHYVGGSGKLVFCGDDSGRDCLDYSGMIVFYPSDLRDFSFYFYHSGYGFSVGTSEKGIGFYIDFASLQGNPSDSFYIVSRDYDFDWLLLPKGFSSSSVPSGSLSITENGTYDVKQYASVDVNVSCPDVSECPENPGGSSGGGLTDEQIQGITNAIFAIPATMLVLYFFYCIYRMIMKSTGGF